jgi:hypothetical protein
VGKNQEAYNTGRINKAKEGKIVGGRKASHGWQWVYNEKGEKVVAAHDNSQLWIVRWLAIKYARGTSALELAQVLTSRGIQTPQGGKQWHPIMIRRILSNMRLTGKAQNFAYPNYLAKEHLEPIDLPDGTYTAFISDELFAIVQERLARNKDESTRRSKRPEEFLLRAGYSRCAYRCCPQLHPISALLWRDGGCAVDDFWVDSLLVYYLSACCHAWKSEAFAAV